MPSTLGYALLTLLARGPRTGYALRQAMREPVGFFWSASHSQIYPELAALERDGLVRHKVIAGRGPRDTKQYRVTAAGRRALAAWAVVPPEPEPDRDELMVKVFALWTAPPEQARAMIAEQRVGHRARLARYEAIEAEFHAGGAPADPSDAQFAAYATLQCGLSYERHRVRWCTWLLGQFDASTG